MKNNIRQSNKIIKGNIIINTKFPTGSGSRIKFLDNNNIELRTTPDPVTNKFTKGYDYYFNISISNKNFDSIKINLYALRPNINHKKIKWLPSKAPVFCSTNMKKWYLLPNVLSSSGNLNYKCPISIPPQKKLYISNNIPSVPQDVVNELKIISLKNPKISIYKEIGKSIKKEPISLISINENPRIKKDRFLIWAGIHPSEPDTMATLYLIKWLLSNNQNAKIARKSYVFDIIPMINPDGFNLGTNGCNAKGVNIYWNFYKKNNLKCPESTLLWDFIKKNPPQVALDIHSYIYQTEKQARPYIISIKSYPKNFRNAAWKMQRSIVKLCNNNVLDGKTAEHNTCLAPHLIKNFGTLTLPGYHLHLADGPEKFKERLINTINNIIKSTSKFQPLYSIKINNYNNIDINGIIWRIIELFFDRIPRRIFKNSNNKVRSNIDSSKAWSKYRFDNPNRESIN